ncbi:MAG: InlB B-repeat-containing protein, partial [Clostridia bacterium]|nr:InlB B-repeat-containing protein [Clostridia bacterium]
VRYGNAFAIPTTKKNSEIIEREGYDTQWIAAVGSTGGVPTWGTTPYDFNEKGTASAPNLYFKLNYALKEYSITYNLEGGTNNPLNTATSYTIESAPVTIYAPTRSGYTFAGWNDGTTTVNQPVIATGSTGNKVYTAVWTANRIIFNANGGQGSMADQLFDKNTVVTLNTNNGEINNENNGMYFVGWATTAGGAVAYVNGASYSCGSADSYTLYAVWAKLYSYNGTQSAGVLGDEVAYNNNLFYTNEEIQAKIPDPFILDDMDRTGYYYAYGTEGDFNCYRSKDLTNWEVLGSSLGFNNINDGGDRDAVNTNIWAPEVIYDSGENKYFMIFSAQPKKRSPYTGSTYSGNPNYVSYLAASANPWGPFKVVDFSDTASVGSGNTHTYTRKYDGTYFIKYSFLNPDDYYENAKRVIEAKGFTFPAASYINGFLNAIDFSFFVDPVSGYKYMYWCGNFNGEYGQKLAGNMIFGVRMTNWYKPDWTTLSIVSIAGRKTSGNFSTDSSTQNAIEQYTTCNEGPQMTYNTYNKLYMLTFSFSGYANATYSLMMSYSASPLGTFTKLDANTQNGIFLSSGWPSINDGLVGNFINKEVTGPGHHTMLKIGDQWYVAYHRHEVAYTYLNSNGYNCTNEACRKSFASNPGTCPVCGGTTFYTNQRVVRGGTGARYLALDELKWVTLSTKVTNGSNQSVNLQALYCNGPTNSVQNKPGEFSGYDNIATAATVTKVSGTLKSGSSVNYLNDGYVPIYNANQGQSFMSTYNVKETEITANTPFNFHFSSPRSVVGFMVYNSRTYANIFKTISNVKITYVRNGQSYTRTIDNIPFSSKYYEGNYISLGSAAFTSFNELQVTDIEFMVEKPSGASTVGIGEVKILGKAGTTADTSAWDYNPAYNYENLTPNYPEPDAGMVIDGVLSESVYSNTTSLSWSHTNTLNEKTETLTVKPYIAQRGIYLGAQLSTNDSTFRFNKYVSTASGVCFFVSVTTAQYYDTYKFYLDIGGRISVLKSRRILNSVSMTNGGAWVDVSNIDNYNAPYGTVTYTGTINSNSKNMVAELYIPSSFFGRSMTTQSITSFYMLPAVTTMSTTTTQRYVNGSSVVYEDGAITREEVVCGEHLTGIFYGDPTTWYQVDGQGFKVRNINITKTGSGSVTTENGYTTFVAGNRVSLKVKPASGYYLSAFTVAGADAMNNLVVSEDGSGYYGAYSALTSNADLNVVATFSQLNSSKGNLTVTLTTGSGVSKTSLCPNLTVYLTRGNSERINHSSYTTSSGRTVFNNLNYGTYTLHVYHNTRHYELISEDITFSGTTTHATTTTITSDMINTFVLGDTTTSEQGITPIIDLTQEEGVNFGEDFVARFFLGLDYSAISDMSQVQNYVEGIQFKSAADYNGTIALQLLKWGSSYAVKMMPDSLAGGNSTSTSWVLTGDALNEMLARNGMYFVVVAKTDATVGCIMDVYCDLGGGALQKLGSYSYPASTAGHAFWVGNIKEIGLWGLEGVDANRLAVVRDFRIKAGTSTYTYFNSNIVPSVLQEGAIDSITGLDKYSLGGTVTFTVKPTNGYTIAVVKGNGNTLVGTDNGNGTYTYSFRATCGALIYVKSVPSEMDVAFIADSVWDADGITLSLSSETTGYDENVVIIGNEAVFTNVITGASDYVLTANIFGREFVLSENFGITKSQYEANFAQIFCSSSIDYDDVNLGASTFAHKPELHNEDFMMYYDAIAPSNTIVYGAKFKLDPEDYTKVKLGLLPEIRIGLNISRATSGSAGSPSIKIEKNKTIINLLTVNNWHDSFEIPEKWINEMLYGNGLLVVCEQTAEGMNVYVGNDFEYTQLLFNSTDDYTFSDSSLTDALAYSINKAGPFFWTTVGSVDIPYTAQISDYKLIYGASGVSILSYFGATRTTKVADSVTCDETKGTATVTAANTNKRFATQFTVSVAPNAGYIIDSVTINGIKVAGRCLSYEQVFAKYCNVNLNVVATFVEATAAADVTLSLNGLNISGVTVKIVNTDTSVTKTAVATGGNTATFTGITT